MQKEVIYISEIRLKTSVTYKGTGSQTQYDFPFDYLRKSFIKVTIDDVLQDTSDYNVDNRSILFNTAPAADSIIVIYRETDTERLVSWADASVLKASDMTISQVQQLHILEEGQDWSKLNSLYLDETDNSWEGNNHKIKNVSYPVNDNDVVTKGYMETVQGGFVMTNTTLKDEAAKQAGIATTKASEAAASASAAKTSETNAASSANMAKRWAEASDSPDNTTSKSAKTWASEAIGSASAAKVSETNAKSSETKAANSATTATEKADVATTKASEASASASAAKTSETNAQNAASAAKTSETNAKNYSENVNVFLPSVSDSGVLSWTNKAGLANPASVNIKGAKGDKGDTGTAATIEVGTVTTGAAGSSASVVNRGDANNAILDFILPKGADGKGSVITVNGKEPDAGGNVDLDIIPISQGGTGASTAKQARENLEVEPIGTIFAFAGNDIPTGYLPCNGSAISRETYADLFEVIGTTYGSGDGSTTFNLPNLNNNSFLEGSSTAGTIKSAGLPNITGSIGFRGESASYPFTAHSGTGAFYNNSNDITIGGYYSSYTVKGDHMARFNASRSSSIYGSSETVQPKSVTVKFFIKY